MKLVFADSYYFFALVNDRDPAHEKVLAFLRTYHGKLLTTSWVITELGDGLQNPVNRSSFLSTLTTIDAEPNIQVVTFSERLHRAGIELYRQRSDKYWSLTDCVSFVVMEENGISDALTGDKHFEQAGFVALFK